MKIHVGIVSLERMEQIHAKNMNIPGANLYTVYSLQLNVHRLNLSLSF
jgi:hypothetical protein